MTEIKTLILCNSSIAIPAIKEFLFYKKVAAIGIPKRNKEMQQILKGLIKDTGAILVLLDKNDYEKQLEKTIKKYEITVGLMMTFPYVITTALINLPPKGFINFHYGLLPQCRGPQPVVWHLLNNDTEAGVTIHKVDEGVDTGPIIIQEKTAIDSNDTYGTLESKLAFLAAKQAATLLKILSYGTFIPSIPQDETKAGFFKMPTASDLTINWNEMTAAQIVRLVNACNPWNKGAGTTINNWFLGITEAEIIGDIEEDETAAGTIIACNKEDGLVVTTMDSQKLKINIVYTNEGFFTGSRLADFGIKEKMKFS